MLLSTAIRGSAIALLTLIGENHLPVSVTLISLTVVILGVLLTVKRVLKGIRLWELAVFHGAEMASIILSIIVLRFFPQDISSLETLITGTVLTILLDGTFLFLAYRKKRYISIERSALAEGTKTPSGEKKKEKLKK